jgi:hypothetical protein
VHIHIHVASHFQGSASNARVERQSAQQEEEEEQSSYSNLRWVEECSRAASWPSQSPVPYIYCLLSHDACLPLETIHFMQEVGATGRCHVTKRWRNFSRIATSTASAPLDPCNRRSVF